MILLIPIKLFLFILPNYSHEILHGDKNYFFHVCPLLKTTQPRHCAIVTRRNLYLFVKLAILDSKLIRQRKI